MRAVGAGDRRARSPSRTSSGVDQHPDEDQLHLPRLDLLAEVLGRAADHQPGDEDGRAGRRAASSRGRSRPRRRSPRRSMRLASGTRPPIPVSESRAALTAPQEVTVVTAVHSEESAMPKRCSLPSMLPPVEPSKAWVRMPACVLRRGAVLLGDVDDADADDEHHHHRRVERPALAPVADHAAEGVGEGGRDDQDQQQLDEVGEAARVLERDGAVDVEEAAAVGAELLDRLLRGDRARARASGCRRRACGRPGSRRGSGSRPGRRGRARRRSEIGSRM